MKYNRTILCLLIFSFCLLFPRITFAAWQRIAIGSGSYNFNDVTVTAGRDGSSTIYLYAACDDNYIHEYVWNGHSWAGGRIATRGDGDFNGVAAGHGRNDGKIRVYGSNEDCRMHEFYYHPTEGWQRIRTNYVYGTFNYCAVGPGRNGDENTYLYGANNNNYIVEYRWNSSYYTYSLMKPSASSDFYGVALGDGRNDGKTRVYGANRDNHLYEYIYNDAYWERTDMGSVSDDFKVVATGPGRNGDSQNYVYGGWDGGGVYEFVWDSWYSTWSHNSIGGPGGSNNHARGLAIGDGRNDGVTRLYAGFWDGTTYEYTWNGSGWNPPINMGDSGGPVYGIAVGMGRQSECTNSVFVSSSDNCIYEYIWLTDTPTVTPTPTFTQTTTHTPTASATATPTPTLTPSASITPTPTQTMTSTITLTPTISPTFTFTPTTTLSATATVSLTVTQSPTRNIATSDLSNVIVYPNPFRAAFKSRAEITFIHLPRQATLRIYNLNGQLVRVIEKTHAGNRVTWDLRNRRNSNTASGVYLYVITSGNEVKKGKVVLLR